MKKYILLLALFLSIRSPLIALVDFGQTNVTATYLQPACLDQRYARVDFNVNWQSNNNNFVIQRSLDPGFSWAVTIANINGCGTCGFTSYSYNDFGPFILGQTWYYRIKAVSNNLVYQYANFVNNSYTHNQSSIVNWVSQVSNQVITGISPASETSYSWFQESREMQGVGISLNPTEISNIYVEQYNNRINLFVSNLTPFISLEVNVDNNGYSSLYSGSATTGFIWQNSISAFSTLGLHNLIVRFSDVGGTLFYREYNVYVVPKSDALYYDNYCNSLRVWKGNDPLNGIPLILSEGFDAYNNKSQQYYRESGKDLINCLLNKGFNIYIIDYKLNSQSIVNNAAVFQSAIRYVSSLNGNKKVVATGMSMGGVINRYACAQAESVSNPLPISKFVSIDGPQRGAVISKDFQDWRKQGLDVAAQNNSPDPYSEHAANNDAAKELLQYNAYDPSASQHLNFYSSLNALNGDGYPHLVEKIGIAFSTNQPNPNSGLWLSVHVQNVPGYYNQSFYLSPEEMVAGSFLPQIILDPMPVTDSKFLSSLFLSLLRAFTNPFVTITQLNFPTFIPYSSALDIRNGVSKFDKIITPPVTGFHDKIPPAIIEDIVNALLEDNVFVQNKTISSTKTTSARKKIKAGENVTPLQSPGTVNVSSSNDVVFKAGEEVSMLEGFQSIQGSEFAAIIGTVECNGQTEFQNRTINPSELESDSLTNLTSISGNTLSFEYDNSSSASSITAMDEPQVLPNPTNGIVYLHAFKNQYLDFQVLGIDNKLLLEGRTETKSIDLGNFDKGIYLLRVTDENGNSYNFKLIKS